ncbi:Uncharacterized protein FWK35_00016932 [Aphis craccivora]|uniref:Reverse transcriptase domain-containing protein n=1 Tax=Aphis craccivora TaxID=307492 RepID=A0A6G0Y419_APHCR|nr:Uncharacterized protein FWK35_00016932 [Aphis craccivora]
MAPCICSSHSKTQQKPISLINTLSKLIEKIINKRLIRILESTKLLTKEQCGFRINHSTLDTLTSLHTDICSAFRCNHQLITIALDITKSYNTVWKKRVLTILHLWKINGNSSIHLYVLRTFEQGDYKISRGPGPHKFFCSSL